MTAPAFMFATGIENSIPTIQGGKVRVDEMEACGHYKHWKTDFDLVEHLGIRFLRYGPPLHTTFAGPDHFDWTFTDDTFGVLRKKNIIPIADLCHFGVPDWIGNFQNPDFPALFASYAKAFAARLPWVQLYTPVNEMYICAMFSARHGWWNEQLATDQAFVTALKHIVKANVLAMRAILDVRPDAIFIQSESSEYFHAENPRAIKPAEIMNAERFLSLDLNYGRRVESEMYEYLMDNGMTREEYHFFLDNNLKHHCILGNDYYITNEHRVGADGSTRASGEVFGYDEITWQYYDRYRLPVMHTETNIEQGPRGDEAINWLWKEWANVLRVRNSGIPVVGFTWYSLTDQVDWDTALCERNNRINPLGLYDLDRNIRPVGEAYRQLINDWRDVLPTQSVCLRVPVVMPSEHDTPWAQQKRARTAGARPPSQPSPTRAASMRFSDRVAIVTGGASGIGLATARRLGEEGARVIVADLSREKGEDAVKAIRDAGAPDAKAIVCNVAREPDVIAAVDLALSAWGRIDVIVNNAGVMTFTAIPETQGEDWIRVLSVDLLGAFYFTKQAFLRMTNGGAIVNVSSIHAIETSPLVAPYAAAKSALLSLTRSAALEGAAKGIRVNAVLPGAVDTPMLWENPNVVSGVEQVDRAVVGKPEDIAATIAYLASDDASFVQGAEIRIDGGKLNRL